MTVDGQCRIDDLLHALFYKGPLAPSRAPLLLRCFVGVSLLLNPTKIPVAHWRVNHHAHLRVEVVYCLA